jgi:oligopeptidase B
MRRNKLHRLSKIAISADLQQIALIATSEETSTRVLLLINRADSTEKLIPIAAHDAMWSDNQHLFVSVLLNQQPKQVYLISSNEAPRLFLSTQKEHESLLLSQSRDGKLFFITRSFGDSSSVLIYQSRSPLQPPLSVDIGHGPGRCTSWAGDPTCIIFTRAPQGQLVLFQNGNKAESREIASGNDVGWLEDLDADQEHLALFIRHATSTKLQVFSRFGDVATHIAPLGPVTTLRPTAKLLADPEVRITSRSFLKPTTSFPLSAILTDRLKLTSSLHTHCSDCLEQSLEAKSLDGALVPISLIRPKISLGLLVLAYGSYGLSQSAEFSELHQSLLHRGFAVAIAHVRGGSERGPSWHTQALAANKSRSVADLLAALEFLQQHLNIPPEKTFLWGRSAGGWLVTKAALTEPGRIHGLLLDAPLLDIGEAISDPTSPLFHGERVEWGTQASSILSLRPTIPLPFHILLHLPLKDELISPLSTARWAMAAHHAQLPGYKMLVKTLSKAGHAGPDSREEERDWNSLQEAFLVATPDEALRASLPETTQAH